MIDLDIETMGVRPDAAILAIGMVDFDFDADVVRGEFYIPVHYATSVREGGSTDPEGVLWWFTQPVETQRKWLFKAIDIKDALTMANEWIAARLGNSQMWARGPQFDCVILRSAMRRVGIEPAWEFRCERDSRTLTKLYPSIEADEFVGIKHFALDDARNDVRHIRKIYRALRPAQQIVPNKMTNELCPACSKQGMAEFLHQTPSGLVCKFGHGF